MPQAEKLNDLHGLDLLELLTDNGGENKGDQFSALLGTCVFPKLQVRLVAHRTDQLTTRTVTLWRALTTSQSKFSFDAGQLPD
jgi:hypothetical protein